jgi:hypothetical protein
MALPRTRRGGGDIGLVIRASVDAERTSDQFKAARKEFNRDLKEAMQDAGEETVLPDAKRNAAGLKVAGASVPASLVVKARGSSAILQSTMRGKKNRAVGLLEFGRTGTKTIQARKKKAMMWIGGWHPVAEVELPPMDGMNFMLNAVNDNLDRFDKALLRHVMRAFDGLDHS